MIVLGMYEENYTQLRNVCIDTNKLRQIKETAWAQNLESHEELHMEYGDLEILEQCEVNLPQVVSKVCILIKD